MHIHDDEFVVLAAGDEILIVRAESYAADASVVGAVRTAFVFAELVPHFPSHGVVDADKAVLASCGEHSAVVAESDEPDFVGMCAELGEWLEGEVVGEAFVVGVQTRLDGGVVVAAGEDLFLLDGGEEGGEAVFGDHDGGRDGGGDFGEEETAALA